jgi:hypothetical protein
MIRIKTSYVGPTNTTGAKIKAQFNGKTVSVPYDYSLDSEERHQKAAFAFADKHDLSVKVNASGSHEKGYYFDILVKN